MIIVVLRLCSLAKSMMLPPTEVSNVGIPRSSRGVVGYRKLPFHKIKFLE